MVAWMLQQIRPTLTRRCVIVDVSSAWLLLCLTDVNRHAVEELREMQAERRAAANRSREDASFFEWRIWQEKAIGVSLRSGGWKHRNCPMSRGKLRVGGV